MAGVLGVGHVYNGYRLGQEGYKNLNEKYVKVIGYSDEKEAANTETAESSESAHEEILPADAPKMSAIDIKGLQQINQDVIGWIEVPAIDVSYPIMQASDNEYYLHRDIYQEYLFAGSIFLDCKNNPDIQDQNSILYGHNMRDGSMFARLKNLRDANKLEECPYFWIYTETVNHLYRIISVMNTSNESSCYQLEFADDNEFESWILEMISSSETESKGIAEASGRQRKVVTLSTCTENSLVKQVVQGIEIASVASK